MTAEDTDVSTTPNGSLHSEAWEHTVADMEALAETRREDEGWDVVTLEPEYTIPLGEDNEHYDVFGFLHHVDDEDAVDSFREIFDRSTFPRYEVYRTEIEESVFFVTELFDSAAETAVLIAGRYELSAIDELVLAADEADELFTHVETPEEELAGAVQHDGYEKFVPDHAVEGLDLGQPEL